MLAAIARLDLKLWFLAIRPLTLPLSVTPVLLGAVLALVQSGVLNAGVLTATLAAAITIQAGTNLLNDAEDFERGNDTQKRRGPPRVTAKGWASASDVKTAATLSFLLAGLLGLYLINAGGWPIFWLGLFSVLSGIAYSAGPRPLSHTPYGELFVFLAFGLFAVAGTFYVQTGELSKASLLVGAMMGSFAASVLHTNNTRDIREDKKAGRWTLAIVIDELVRGGFGHSARLPLTLVYALFVLAPFMLLLLLMFWQPQGLSLGLVLFCLPGAIIAIRRFYNAQTGSQSNRLLVTSIGLQLLFATLLSIGLVM